MRCIGRDQGRRIGWQVHAGQEDFEGRALTHFAVEPHATAALLHEPEHRRQAEASPLALVFGREKWLEDTSPGSLVDALAGIGDGEHHVRTGVHAQVQIGIFLVEPDVAGLQGQLAALGHRVARVHDQIHDHLFEAARIDFHAREFGSGARRELDVGTDDALQHLFHTHEHVVQVEHLGFEHLLAAEHQQLTRQIGGAQGGFAHLFDVGK